ncbi:CocE/NonD family hydrolase [Kordiimonas pumila]|uniref:CocE/NonD family hydrolase n=1 Tax=Kordiimonas pumila TaxID=2161677 RepID=A0ABV7D6I9_9PROT|nr:CocE/NonD family hydrolase [Kordiimonas pumila]
MRHAAIAILALLSFAVTAVDKDYSLYSEEALQNILAQKADLHSKEMVPTRDGTSLASDIYIPKGAKGVLPTILWRTPYNYSKLNWLQLRYAAEAIDNGFIFIIQNERGRYFSEGEFEILGHPRTDGYDTLSWIEKQSWSNGKVGTLGCSSSAEWQLALAAQNHPAHAAMVPMASGAGIGRVGPFQEQGNWYTGGVPRTLFFVWLYHVDNPLRATIPFGLDQETRARIASYNDLAAQKPKVDWPTRIKHLPLIDLLTGLGEPEGTYEKFIARKPNDPEWFEGGLYHDNEGWGVPALWFNSWYDVSIGPNLALFNHARNAKTDKEASANQYAVIAPVPHCQYNKLGPDTVVGERPMGDTSFEVDKSIFAWFDYWLKGNKSAWPKSTPPVQYFTMGENKWNSSNEWPPRKTKSKRFYLHSDGNANSLYGDGTLRATAPETDQAADTFVYDPQNPVQTIGGADCCNGGLVIPGAYDQRIIEARNDVLVYTTEAFDKPLEITGAITPVIYVSSDAKDTDFAVKLVDVTPEGTAYIIGDTILRARYREGFDKEVMMDKDQVYKLELSPMTTSLTIEKGHKIRIEITSSNFPKFARNLNTGGDNVTESESVTARNSVHHTIDAASYIEFSIMP